MATATSARAGRVNGLCWVRLPAAGALVLLLVLCRGGDGQGQEETPAANRAAPASPAPSRGLQDVDSAHDVFDSLQQLTEMRQQVGLRAQVAGVPVGVQVEKKSLAPRVGGLTPGGWKWLGPGNAGGTTLALLSHPKKPRCLFAGSSSGGLWQSSNGGERWSIADEIFGGVGVSCLAIDPANPEVIYAGTGSGYDNYGFSALGVAKTTDGGATWKPLASTRDFYWINQLAMSADGRVLLAATPIGLWRSSDGGASWKRAGDIGEVTIQDVRFHPAAAEHCVAGGWRGVAYYSHDSGVHWKRAEGLPTPAGPVGNRAGRVVLACAAAAADVVYASVDVDKGRLYRSDDGGQTFKPTHNDQPYLADTDGESQCLWAGDPKRADLVVAGGFDLWRSSDGGKTFAKISSWEKGDRLQRRVFFKTIVSHSGYDGSDNRAIYVGSQGGVHRADDVTTVSPEEGWQGLNSGYGTTEMVGVAGHPETATLIAGCSSLGTLMYTRPDGPDRWTFVWGGNGGYCAADPRDPECLFGSSWCLQLFRSLDGGKSGQEIFQGIKDAGKYDSALLTSPFLLDPNDSRVLLAGGKSLWRCGDARADEPTWKEIKPSTGQLISAIAVARGSSDTIWVGYNNGELSQTSNGSAERPAWKRITDSRLPRKRFCSRIVIDPANSRRIFVLFVGYQANNLWMTEDGGASWAAVPIRSEETRPLAAPLRDLAIHPANPRCLYLATDVGILASEDGGKRWSPTNEGPTSCAVRQLLWMDRTLVAATYGRGVFQIDLSGVRAATEP